MDEHEITQRLRDAGRQRVPGDVRSTHLTQMHAATPTLERPKRFGRVAVAAAAIVGFTVGSTGFAMAGALPDPAQQVAHDVLAVVQVDVENPRNRGQCISGVARDTTLTPEQKADGKQRCKDAIQPGPPDGVGEGRGRPDHAGVPGGPNGVPHAGDPCKGPPPWAGKGAKDVPAEEKQAFEDARAACPDDDGDDAAEDQAEALEDEQERQAEALERQQEAEAQQPPQPPVDPGADQRRQGGAPEEAPAGPPAGGAPGEQVPPVEVPTPGDDTDPDAG